MDRLKKARAPLRAQLTKLNTSVTAMLLIPDPDKDVLQVKLELLETSWMGLQEADVKVKDQLLDDDAEDQEMEAEQEAIEQYQETYILLKNKLRKILEPPVTVAVSTHPSEFQDAVDRGDRKRSFKLPTIQLMRFDGDLKNWLAWWSQFQKIHLDPNIDEGDKFQYLSQAVTDGSEAKEILSGYPHSAENYPKAIEALQDRYGRDDLQLQYYVRELLTLVISNVTKKEKLPLSSLHLKLESHLRCLTTLKLDQADPATWLFPLVESSLSEETLRAWQRSPSSKTDGSTLTPPKTRLELLMDFIKTEVRTEQQISMAQRAFQSTTLQDPYKKGAKGKVVQMKKKEDFPTAAGLIAGPVCCAFCDGKHESDRCPTAQDKPYQEKKEKAIKRRLCFRCLLPGHPVNKCRITVRCHFCKGKHYAVFCPGEVEKQQNEPKSTSSENDPEVSTIPVLQTTSSSANQCSTDVLLNIIQVRVEGSSGSMVVRMVGDTGSQRSYIRQEVVRKLGLERIGQEYIQNVLFGGATTQPTCTEKFAVKLADLRGQFSDVYEFLERPQICGYLPKVPNGPWIKELQEGGIQISDVGVGCAQVDILVGSDVWGNLLTGNLRKLKSGLVAVETMFGWTVSGRISTPATNLAVEVTTSMMNSSKDISFLWSLETIGIQDPIEVQSKEEEEFNAMTHFRDHVERDSEGRYIVSLPWKESLIKPPTNREVAEDRLEKATKKLKKDGNYKAYDEIMAGWEKEGLISVVQNDRDSGHYLPHRGVSKESVTTPLRPVFDASCQVGKKPSLNDCLYKGPNLLELIPTLLLRFREHQFGVSADIRKAFQMLLVKEADRKYQKFLWWENESCQQLKVYQHNRVVFGMNCSPFLLAATILHHLENGSTEADPAVIALLKDSYYVDNLVTSVPTKADYVDLKSKATAIMKSAGMELRQWASTLGDESGAGLSSDEGCRLGSGEKSHQDEEQNCLGLLGMKWDRVKDTLYCVAPEIGAEESITKRFILSAVARIYDPIGILAPALIPPKQLLQGTWIQGVGWKEKLQGDIVTKFLKWAEQVPSLGKIEIPRQFQLSPNAKKEVHVFVDASSTAYAATVFLRSEEEGRVMFRLLLAKARLSPIKKNEEAPKPTIPRLELMSCLMGVRLAEVVKKVLKDDNIPFLYWSDSTTALAWIRRHDEWGTFVGNRVLEIRKHTEAAQWRHVPGVMNPADLPSRGCSPNELLMSNWWEGPSWLYDERGSWPNAEEELNEEDIAEEMRKTPTTTLVAVTREPLRFSSYRKNVEVLGWVLRFVNNLRLKENRVKRSHLSIMEMRAAEKVLLRQVQEEAFPEPSARIGGMMVKRDEKGLLRVETRLTHRKDTVDFICPVILPKEHPIVDALIMDIHRYNWHGGVQFLMSKIREKYWILHTRRTIKRVLLKCSFCRRFEAKALKVRPSALPERRVENCEPFQTTGVDLFGHLFLKDGTKVWVVIFTCAYYRAVHLDPILSESTEAFLGALERFVAIYGRPNTIYSDNGTNFHGAANLFKKLNWEQISEQSNVRQIQWIFNPPTAAWWGGFWERMVRSVKDLMKRVLRKSKMSFEDLRTCLAGVCATINDRPLTVVSEDGDDLVPLTPAMFLRRQVSGHMPEIVTGDLLQKSFIRMKAHQQQLQERFRKEYISLLVQRGEEKGPDTVKVGDVVLVGADNKKRFQWPLGLVEKLVPGKDGHVRVAIVRTETGQHSRALQRLFPLEISCKDFPALKKFQENERKKKMTSVPAKQRKQQPEQEEEVKARCAQRVVITKKGRVVRTPARYGEWPK